MSILREIIDYLDNPNATHPFDCRPVKNSYDSRDIVYSVDSPSKRWIAARKELKDARARLDCVEEWLEAQVREGLDGGVVFPFSNMDENTKIKADLMVEKWKIQDKINRINKNEGFE